MARIRDLPIPSILAMTREEKLSLINSVRKRRSIQKPKSDPKEKITLLPSDEFGIVDSNKKREKKVGNIVSQMSAEQIRIFQQFLKEKSE